MSRATKQDMRSSQVLPPIDPDIERWERRTGLILDIAAQLGGLVLLISVFHFLVLLGLFEVEQPSDLTHWWQRASVPFERLLQFPVCGLLWRHFPGVPPIAWIVASSICWAAFLLVASKIVRKVWTRPRP